MPSGTSFAKAKSDLIEVDKTINRVLLNARRMYVITLEVAIKRYQHAMWQTLTSYEHKLSVSVGSSGHHIPVVVNIVADLHRIAELNLQTAANIGFTRALEDMKERGWIAKFDQPVVAPRSIVDDSIKENRKYLEQSLLPDLKRDLDQCKTADDVPRVIAKYRSRIFLYGHWSWRTAERAYRDGMKQFVQFADRKHNVREVGTASSGDHDHVGNPGHVGGSGPSTTTTVESDERKDRHLLRISFNGSVIGGASIVIPKNNPTVAHIGSVWVGDGKTDKSPLQGRGLGTHVYTAIKNFLAEHSIKTEYSDFVDVRALHLSFKVMGGEARVFDTESQTYKVVDEKRALELFKQNDNSLSVTRIFGVKESFVEVGTASSGDRGHVGRKGQVGGSGPSDPPTAPGSTKDEVLANMGLQVGGYDPSKGATGTFGTPEYRRAPETRLEKGPNGSPLLVDYVDTGKMVPQRMNERPLPHVYRAISEEDYQRMKRDDVINTDARMNLVNTEGLVTSHEDPSWYLPGKLASNPDGEYPGRVIRIRVESSDGWKVDTDGYIKTNEHLPFSRIDMVSPKIVTVKNGSRIPDTHIVRESLIEIGTASSGDHAHVGRPGQRGGSGVGFSAGPVQTTAAQRTAAIKEYVSDFGHTDAEGEQWAKKIEAHDPATVKEAAATNFTHFSTTAWAVNQQTLKDRVRLANDNGLFNEHAKDFHIPVFDARLNSPRSMAIIDRELHASKNMPNGITMFVSIKDDPQASDTDSNIDQKHTYAYVRGGAGSDAYQTLALNTDPKIWTLYEREPKFDVSKNEGKVFNFPWSASDYTNQGARQEAVLTHEMGHVLENTLSKGNIAKFNALANEVTAVSTRGEYVYKDPTKGLSKYALENRQEFFAENYAAYRYGNTEHMHPAIVSYFKDMLKINPIDPALREAETKEAVTILGTLEPMRADYVCNYITDTIKHYAHISEALVEGGPGSGDRGHLGRKGVVGGSGPAEAPVGHVQTAANEVGVDPNGPAPWDLKAPAPLRYPGDNSIYSPAIPDAHGNFVLGRRIQGLKLDSPNDPNQVAMYTFIPDSVTQDQLAHYEGIIKDNADHAQTHPGFIAYVDSKGELQRTQGNNYWIRADYRNLNKLSDELTPKLTEQFGKNTFTTMMTNVTPGGTQITKGDALEHMRVVVPFAEGTPKNTVGESSLDRATRDKILTAMSGSEGRHVWEHADFNGIHIAVSTTPDVVDKLFPVVTALGGLRDKEEETHHNTGATRFIPTKINLERYPVRGYKESFVEADDTQGVLLYFIGPDDSETCDGCSDAVNGNPYTPDDAPEPGEFECMARCRHMLQADGAIPDDSPTYEWSGSIGFGETSSTDEEPLSAVDEAVNALQADIEFDAYMKTLASDMDTLDYSTATLNQIDIKNLDEEQLANFTSVMVDSGVSLEGLSTMMDLTDVEFSILQGAFASAFADITDDDLLFLLGNGDVDSLQQMVKDVGGDVLEALTDMGVEGFDDADAVQAETLAQVLNKTAAIDDKDGRWYVL